MAHSNRETDCRPQLEETLHAAWHKALSERHSRDIPTLSMSKTYSGGRTLILLVKKNSKPRCHISLCSSRLLFSKSFSYWPIALSVNKFIKFVGIAASFNEVSKASKHSYNSSNIDNPNKDTTHYTCQTPIQGSF